MKKEHEPTVAQGLFSGADILVARPPDMSFEQYKGMRKLQTKMIKRLFKKQFNKTIYNAMNV